MASINLSERTFPAAIEPTIHTPLLASTSSADALNANQLTNDSPIPPPSTGELSLGQSVNQTTNFSGEFSPFGSRKKCWYCSFCFSIFLLVILPLIVNDQIRKGVIAQVVMDSEHASGYPMFRNRSSQGGTNMEYWFFNITNPHEVLNGAKPKLVEIGPFIYAQTQLRDDLHFDYERDLLSFRQQIYQTFLPDETFRRTNGKFNSEYVTFTTINVLFLGMKSIVGKEFWHLINDVTLWNTDYKRLFETRTVHEMIEGYSVPLKLGPVTVPINFPGFSPSFFDPKTDPEYKYKNTIYMGRKDLTKTNSLVEWGKGKTHAVVTCPWGNNPLSKDCKQFKNNPCCGVNLQVRPWGQEVYPGLWNEDANLVQGTFGDAFRPFLKRRDDEKVVVWSDQLARPLQFHNRNAQAVNLEGIALLRFTATREFWSNATVHPPNARYYQFGPNGLLNASVIYQGAPIFASLPHFLDCDPSLLEAVEGLNPDPEQHQMFLDIEPTTGMTFREHNRIQINAFIKGREKFGFDNWFKDVRDAYIPIGYFDAHSEINNVGIRDFLELYNGLSIFYGAMSLGLVLFATTVLGSPIYTWFKRHHRSRKSKKMLLRQRSLERVLSLEDDGSVSSLT